MRMMLVGAGAVGESIVKVMQWRDPKGMWLEYVLVCDYDKSRAQEVVDKLHGDARFEAEKVNATDREDMKNLIRTHKIDFVMDAAPPFAAILSAPTQTISIIPFFIKYEHIPSVINVTGIPSIVSSSVVILAPC